MIRLLLEAYHEPTFSDRSHGFRPRKGCPTALREVANTRKGTTWFIEADIVDCFGSSDHEVMISTVAEKIHDNRFLALLRHMLTAGYPEDWAWNATLSGAPQGGAASPILSNIYLNHPDHFAETVLIPDYTRGTGSRINPAHDRARNQMHTAHRRGNRIQARQLRQQPRATPSKDPTDPGYRKLRHTRYADDQLPGLTGPKAEAEEIKSRLAEFLRDELALELPAEKTLTTHARTRAARSLGYDMTTQTGAPLTHGRRATSAAAGLRAPQDVAKAKTTPHPRHGKPAHRNKRTNKDDHTIVATYGSTYRGTVQHYLPASNLHRFNRPHWVTKTSMPTTLPAKHRPTVTKMATKHQATIPTPHGPHRCHEARTERKDSSAPVARSGGIPLKRQHWAATHDRRPVREPYPRKELTTRLLHGRREPCTSTDDIHVHHVAHPANPAKPGPQPDWTKHMTQQRRKNLTACHACHDTTHPGTPRTTTP